ncbi:MAG: CDGSH iron-sulfur domain-containing protein [Candidatus ainarchaeum sp.]|nr:CDGSH iron-sulfur domain-containing protein [Candidatus ainarchaeum sp.]
MAKSKKEFSGKKDCGIVVSKDGPYLVSGGLPLVREIAVPDSEGHPVKWVKGKVFPAKGDYALCRCGQTEKKPFCDGTHTKIGFDGTETASRKEFLKQAEKISGSGLVLFDAPELCAGAGFCHSKEGDTWNLTKESDNFKSKKIAIQQACDCPAGRLVACEKKTGKPIEPDFKPGISITKWQGEKFPGPFWIKGGVPIESHDGKKYETRNRVTLCHCGKSRNKPFCDGSHM